MKKEIKTGILTAKSLEAAIKVLKKNCPQESDNGHIAIFLGTDEEYNKLVENVKKR